MLALRFVTLILPQPICRNSARRPLLADSVEKVGAFRLTLTDRIGWLPPVAQDQRALFSVHHG
ncbi:hypothetical protein D3C84_493890 [compost metagenome]